MQISYIDTYFTPSAVSLHTICCESMSLMNDVSFELFISIHDISCMSIKHRCTIFYKSVAQMDDFHTC